MNKFKKIGLVFVSTVLNLIAGGIIYYFWQPIAFWYWRYRPVLGVDFYNLAAYVGYLARHFVWPFNGWKYTTWGGGPLSLDYPTLHAYLALPLLRAFSLVQAIQLYILVSAFLFLFFAYLLFAEISKDKVLAVVLALAFSFSLAFYGGLVWGGSLHYFATQFFLPLVLWLLIKFFNTTDKSWFYLSSLFLGISFLAHPLAGFSYFVPITFLLLLAWPVEGEKFFRFERIKRLLTYFLIALLIGYPELGPFLGRSPLQILTILPGQVISIFRKMLGIEKAPLPTAGGDPTITAETAPEIVAFNRNQLGRFITDTHQLFFLLLAAAAIIFVLSFLIRKKRRNSGKVIVFALPVLWVVFYNFLLGLGISVMHGGWYRVFWPFPLVLGMLISFVWGDFWASIKERLGPLGQKTIFSLLIPILAGLISLGPALILLSQNSAQKMITKIETPGYRQQSSAFPDSLNVYIEKEEFGDLKERLTPSWLDPKNTQYRLYDADQRVNIWWNALYDTPLVKGYIEFPPGDAFTGAFYWTSIALSESGGGDSLVESWGLPEEMAYNNALFLIDWFSIKYIEAEHEKSDSYNPLTSYLVKNDIFKNKEKVIIPGWVELYTPTHQPINWHPEEEELLTYYEVKDELVSPIAHPTNASVVGVISEARAYHTIIRDLAAINLNSKRVLPIRLGQFIDNVSYQSLQDMEAVILYAYDYKNHGKAWGKLEKYVREGGKVFIETGSDVKQTDSANLPAKYPQELPNIFPIKMTKQEAMGTNWSLSGEGSKETEGVNLKLFGPPIIDDQPWLFSQPSSTSDLKEGARVILANKGIPLIVSWQYGEGEVIWSGMNLPYHLTTHKNLEEAKLFKNLLKDLVDISAVFYQDFETNRESANKMVIKGSNAKGVFFRENSNPGWQARLKSRDKSRRLKIYQAGPTYYGFSYVRMPEEAQESFTVTFTYQGEFWVYFWQLVSFGTILLILDRVVLGSRLLVPIARRLLSPVRKKVGSWWGKEEEY